MRRAVLSVAVLFASVAVTPGARAAGSSLPEVSIGPRPGPAVLYEPLASAPQLENANGWRAQPLMVSGTDAYADGEYLYQDFIYDSYGANTTDQLAASPDTVPASTSTLFGAATGDVVYPTDAATYGFDAADLLEFRARTNAGATEYRATLNTMLAPGAAAIAIGISDGDGEALHGDDWGYGIGSLGALELDDVIVATQGFARSTAGDLPVSVDATRNQIEVRTPGELTGTIRHYVVAGLWDAATSRFKQILDSPTATSPGGAHGTTPPPIFNIGFRFDEPMGSLYLSNPDVAKTTETGGRTVGFGHFREHAQAKALAARNIAAFGANIDFNKLAARVTESHVPSTGYLNRLYASHLDIGEGAKASRPMYVGKIQPYTVYVPPSYDGSAAPLHLLMHSLSSSYNQYGVYTPNQFVEIGAERGSLVLVPAGRGPDGWYHDEAEVDVFEAWADLAADYAIDAEAVTVGGYSMGGYGTYRFASQYPDLFAKGFAVVGPADESIAGGPTGGQVEDKQNTLRIADNLRNIPLLMWHGTNDELVPVAGPLQYEKRLADLGYRHKTEIYPGYDHFLFSVVDQWDEGRDFLGAARVNRNPEQVVYRAMPEMDNTALGLVHDHAYWVSDVRVASGARSGLVDARSEAQGIAPPVATRAFVGNVGLFATYASLGTEWSEAAQASSNALHVTLTDVDGVTVWIERAGIDAAEPVQLAITTNRQAVVTLAGAFGERDIVVAGTTTQTITL